MTAPLDRALRRSRYAVSTLFFLNGVLFATWVSRIPALQSQHGLSHAQLGLALLALALGAAISMPPTGWLIHRFGSKAVCDVSAAAYCLLIPLIAEARTTPLLLAALLGFGLAHGSTDVAMNAQAVAVERRYGRSIMSSFHALFSAGGLSGAALGGLAAQWHVSPSLHFVAMGAVMLIAALAAFPRLLPASAEPKAVREMADAVAGTAARGHAPLRFPPALMVLSLVALCSMMGEGAMADWSALYLREVRGAGDGLAAAGYAAFSLAMAAVRLGGDPLAERLGRERLVRCAGSLAGAGLLAALVVPGTWVALAGFTAVGAGFATIVPMVFSAAGNQPGVTAGVGIACVTTVGYTGFIAGPPLIGFVADAVGLHWALGIIVASSFAIAAMATALRGPSRAAPLPSSAVINHKRMPAYGAH